MNSELIDEWEKIVGHNRMKIISNKFFDSRLDLEFPYLQEGHCKYKKLSMPSELENNANMLIEFERNGFLTHDEVLKMIEASTRNIINKNIPGALFENISLMIYEEILKIIKNRLIEIERKGFLTHDEVSRIVKVLARNFAGESMLGALFEYVCILLDDERIKDQGEDERLELMIRYIRWSLVIEEEKLVNEEEKRLE
ncbi:hypothetical protein [Candidatus Methanoperedens nitratireducens]|uniref:Uncharacterized protein n=1 Tax=Candidatus Methanoperedens nitratireducens TaxID=1392998 RepID=A0A284VPF2_9EURY|nr:hypothetical protein [Candidatus Methanoperedens nitroreducens]SNQ61057.1 hypothetical protein MNV_2240005 [Candidatus Methanoperedens nitroreducens]